MVVGELILVVSSTQAIFEEEKKQLVNIKLKQLVWGSQPPNFGHVVQGFRS